MSEPDDLDALLKEHFDREHRHVAADPFLAAATRRVRVERRRMAAVRGALQVLALVALVVASPWLIAGARWLDSALASSLSWTAGLPAGWVLGVIVLAMLLVSRARN